MRQALAAGEFEELEGGRFRVAGHELEPDEVLVERGGREGWAVASGDGVTVALDLGLDDELVLEGEAYELIHRVNSLRKEQGFELSDRIVLTVPEAQRELVDRHGDWIKREVLAVDVKLGGRARAREELGRGALGAAQLDRKLEAHVLVDGRLLAHLGAARPEPVADLGTSRSGAEAPDVRPTVSQPAEPALVDPADVVHEMRRAFPPRAPRRRGAPSSRSSVEPTTRRGRPRAAAPSRPIAGSRSRNRCPRAPAPRSEGSGGAAPRRSRSSRRPRASSG